MPRSGERDYPNLTVSLPYELVPSSEWDAGKFLVFDAINDGPYMADVECRFLGAGSEMTIRLGLFPGLITRVAVPLRYLDSQVVIAGRTPHRFKCVCSGGPIDPRAVEKVHMVGRTFGGDALIRMSEPALADEMPREWPKADHPIVDDLQQWAEHDWPGKVESLEGIRGMLTEELFATEPPPAEEIDRWGGWAMRKFEASGFFRAERDGERWWLVDPDGYGFYSLGVNCIRPNSVAEAHGNEDLFVELPARDGPFDHLWDARDDGERSLFDAMRYNLVRSLGEDWFAKWAELCRRRMFEWGFNTVGNWSHPDFWRLAQMPHVMQLADFPTTQKKVFRDFPDVFSEEYERNSRRFAEQLEQKVKDRYLIGYFLRNEPHWAFGEYNLAERMLLQADRFASRDRLVEWLRERYGDIARLNAAWGADFGSFEVLATAPVAERNLTCEAARTDLRQFNRALIERYIRVPSRECKKVDPNHMNLGLRYAWIAHEDLLAGVDAFDVFSLNCYAARPDADVVRRCSEAAGAPVLIGEFHTGALDRGLPGGGLRTVVGQQDRADSYRYYVEQAAAIPSVVGTHYFQWNDQHVVGRYDGENWQIGLVDVCQQPYEELVGAARRSHARVYRVAAGQIPPFDRLPGELPMA